MRVQVQIPDEIVPFLGPIDESPHRLIEALVADGYRTGKLSRHQVSRALELDYWQTEDFLTRHHAKRPYTLADAEIDRRSLAGLDSP
ncbi:MAG: UPF0175 family protein [Verrucomicrobiales bacterium]|nr:UPF0175 family protein [Verrucomicrobiales bacterium]